jgi:hypothetical protein
MLLYSNEKPFIFQLKPCWDCFYLLSCKLLHKLFFGNLAGNEYIYSFLYDRFWAFSPVLSSIIVSLRDFLRFGLAEDGHALASGPFVLVSE